MINLLPPSAHSKATWEYRRRLAAVGAFIAVGVFVIGIISLVPSYFAARVAERAAEAGRSSSAHILEDPGLLAAAHQEEKAQILFAALLPKEASQRPSALIEIFTAVRGSGISVREVNYAVQGETIQTVLGGIASTRDVLLGFKSALAKLPGVKSAEFPASDLAASSTILFSMKIIYAPPVSS